MPALAGDIAAGTRRATILRHADPALQTVFPSARDGAKEADEGFFDDPAHAQIVANQRGEILARTRRFVVDVEGSLALDPSTGTPTVRLIDADQQVNMLMFASRIEEDAETEMTSLELY